jgi:hypothetical protein
LFFSKYDSVKQTVNMETDEIDFRPAHSGTGRQGYSALSSSEPTINVNVTDDDGQAVRNLSSLMMEALPPALEREPEPEPAQELVADARDKSRRIAMSLTRTNICNMITAS